MHNLMVLTSVSGHVSVDIKVDASLENATHARAVNANPGRGSSACCTRGDGGGERPSDKSESFLSGERLTETKQETTRLTTYIVLIQHSTRPVGGIFYIGIGVGRMFHTIKESRLAALVTVISQNDGNHQETEDESEVEAHRECKGTVVSGQLKEV